MAKRQNHYIPRMLLARFASRRDRNKAWVWQLRPGKEPREVSVRDVGVATYFYGNSDTGVEELLSDQEGRIASILDAIEAGANPATYDADLRRWVHTLAYRTRHIRDAFTEGVDELLNEMVSSVDSDSAQRAGWAYVEANVDKILVEVLSGLPQDQRNSIVAALQKTPNGWQSLRAYAVQCVSQGDLGKIAKEFLLKAKPFVESDRAAQRGQVTGLSRILNSGPHETPIAVDSWHVVRADRSHFILGDCCIFCVDEQMDAYALPAQPRDFKELYVPLSKHCVVVGIRGPSQPGLSIPQINLAAARVSREMIFAASPEPCIWDLSNVIGTSSSYLRGKSVQRMVQDLWEEMRQNAENGGNSPQA